MAASDKQEPDAVRGDGHGHAFRHHPGMQLPALDIRILWQSKSSKVGLHGLVPAEWCEWRGYPFAIKALPDEWVAELLTKEEFKASGLPKPPRWIANMWNEEAVV
ncbi:hypothetical protein [Magnetospirillum gryphiswaldense]|nr:hypothetical protein [Magnetospirillum gryphiswaldense]